MIDTPGSIRPIFAAWQSYNDAIVATIGALSDEQLALRPAPDQWPIWAVAGHIAETRVYWLCGILGEPGADATPFTDPLARLGWEGDEDHPRSAAELVDALTTTWGVIDGCLDRWTADMLGRRFVRDMPSERQHHSRAQILTRLLTHDAYHSGEISQTLGRARLGSIYLWGPDHTEALPAEG